MAISVACRCGKGLRVGEELAGLRARCPACGRSVRIPSPSGAVEHPGAAPRNGGGLVAMILIGLLFLGLAGGVGFGIVWFSKSGAIDAQQQLASAPIAPVPIPADPPLERTPPVKPMPEAPMKPAPVETSSPRPVVELQRATPAEPQAGKDLTLELKGNLEGLKYEYRADPDADWQAAPEGRIALTFLKPGPLTIEARAQDDQKRVSEVVTWTWLVQAGPPSTFGGISEGPMPETPEKGRVAGGEPPKEPMKPLIQPGPMPMEPKKPLVQGGDPRRDPQLLVWKLKPGDKFFQEVLAAQKSTFRILGLDTVTNLQYTVLSSFTIDKRNDDGSLNVTQKVEAARLVQADPLTEGLLSGAIQKMPGTIYKLTLNPQMEVTKFEGHDNQPQVVGNPFGGGGGAFAMASLIDRDGWKELDQLTFFQPGRPLKQNDRWQKPMTHSWGALGSWNGQVAYGYQGKQGQFHRVAYGMNLAHAPANKPGASGLPFQVSAANFKHQEAGGMIYFDLEKGRVIGAEERFHVKGQLGVSAGGQTAPIDVDEEQAFRIIVHEKNPWGK